MNTAPLSAETPDPNGWHARRGQARQRFDDVGFPSKREEPWKYTSLKYLKSALLRPAPAPLTVPQACHQGVLAPHHYRLLFVDGHLCRKQSRLPRGAEVVELAGAAGQGDAPRNDAMAAWMAELDVASQPGHVALNVAEAAQALCLHLPAGTALDAPLEVHYSVSSYGQAASSYTQLWVMLEAGAEATLIERFYGEEPAPSARGSVKAPRHLQSQVARIALASEASLTHHRLQDLPEDAVHVYHAEIEAGARSRYQGFAWVAGAAISRQEVEVALRGEGIVCDQRGVVLGHGEQHHDAYLPVNHYSPRSYSNQHFHQLLDDRATGIYYGRAHVPLGSHGTEAHQLGRNLLLASGAQAVARPELDIYTDDVICTHGAATGKLDAAALYYLQARGMPLAQARALLTRAFAMAVVDTVENDALRDHLVENLTSRLQ